MFYRLQQRYNAFRFGRRTKIYSSAPLHCDPDAPCAIHTMLSHRDLPLYLVAIKSFLKWCSGVAVLVHSDGTLTASDENRLLEHVPGCKVIGHAEANERARSALDSNSFLSQCRGWDASWRRVIDTEIWASTPARIIMDSDILIINRPDEVLEWIDKPDRPFLLGQPPPENSPDPITTQPTHIQSVFRQRLPKLAQALGLAAAFPQGATSGFYGCGPRQLSLPLIKQTVEACITHGIPVREWGSEQCLVIYLLAAMGAKRLDREGYLNFDFAEVRRAPRAKVVHFLGYCRYYRNVYENLASQALLNIKSAGTPTAVPV